MGNIQGVQYALFPAVTSNRKFSREIHGASEDALGDACDRAEKSGI